MSRHAWPSRAKKSLAVGGGQKSRRHGSFRESPVLEMIRDVRIRRGGKETTRSSRRFSPSSRLESQKIVSRGSRTPILRGRRKRERGSNMRRPGVFLSCPCAFEEQGRGDGIICTLKRCTDNSSAARNFGRSSENQPIPTFPKSTREIHFFAERASASLETAFKLESRRNTLRARVEISSGAATTPYEREGFKV